MASEDSRQHFIKPAKPSFDRSPVRSSSLRCSWLTRNQLATFSASESFLLIARTRHIFTIVNVLSDVTMSSARYSGVPAYSRIL